MIGIESICAVASGVTVFVAPGPEVTMQTPGLPVTRVMVTVGLLSGALAGLGGASEVAGLKGYLTTDLSRGFGYAGIVVAMVAGLDPLAVVPSAIFIAGVFVGADTMSRTIGVSSYIADLIVALSLLCVLVGGLFVRYRMRFA